MARSKVLDALTQITDELKNFERIAKAIKPRPGSIPTIDGIDVYGETLPLNGIVGGDHLIYMDFKKRYDLDARIALAREAGQDEVARKLEAAMVHQAFLMGALYELDLFGNITNRLFENLNIRLNRSSLVNKFVTALYGEISAGGRFRFLSAAHPPPLIFSAEHDRFMEVAPEMLTVFPPLGTVPSEHDIDRREQESVMGLKGRYEINEWHLMGVGDIMLLHTDGLTDHARGEEPHFPDRLEHIVRSSKHLPAAGIVEAIKADLEGFAEQLDDITLVAIKRV
jgi:serine phosphatase RsbU (regulator of sigma subunit)